MEGPTQTWHGPSVGGGYFSSVAVSLRETYQGGLPENSGVAFAVPGAEEAYGTIEPNRFPQGDGTFETTRLTLYVLVGGRQVVVDAVFADAPEGERTARQLIDSLSVTALSRADGLDEDGVRQDQQVRERELAAAARAELAPGVERMSATFAALPRPVSLLPGRLSRVPSMSAWLMSAAWSTFIGERM